MDYTTHAELHKLIKDELASKYILTASNVIYLEELDDKNYVVYMSQYRDVLTHILNIYSVDDIVLSKAYILEQLERAKGHLERVAIDSFKKVVDSLLRKIKVSVKQREYSSLRAQIALKVKDLRISEESISFEDKVYGFKQLIPYLESILKKF